MVAKKMNGERAHEDKSMAEHPEHKLELRTPLFVLPDVERAREPMPPLRMHAEELRAYYGKSEVLKGITLPIPDKRVTAIIGPSGCGKSTFLRTLNRMHETTPGASVKGFVFLDDENIYTSRVNPVRLRRYVGMVFQKPNPFPSMSIRENVLAGFRLNGIKPKNADEVVERALRQAALWDEVKDVLGRSGQSLSGGQQQRLCIARSLALEPEVLLMDEPASALDPIASARIEELIRELRDRLTIVIVTHNMQQAARVSDYTAFFFQGELVEHGPTADVFSRPTQKQTEDYVHGRFG
jgi:phosphate transport system ATP-binding protein